MNNNENNRLLLQQLEAHASDANLLNKVRSVSKDLKNIKIYKNKYLVIDPTSTFSKSKKAKSKVKNKK